MILNLKTWLRGTHRGVGADHLDPLNEFVLRSSINAPHARAGYWSRKAGRSGTF